VKTRAWWLQDFCYVSYHQKKSLLKAKLRLITFLIHLMAKNGSSVTMVPLFEKLFVSL